MGFSQTSTTRNTFGGFDEYRNGALVSSSRPNIFGGFDRTVFSLHAVGGNDAIGAPESALADILGYHGPSDDDS